MQRIRAGLYQRVPAPVRRLRDERNAESEMHLYLGRDSRRAAMKYFLLPLMLLGCATYKPLPTASGAPEVTVEGKSKADVKNILMNKMIDRGFKLHKESESSLTFSRQSSSIGASILASAQMGQATDQRINLNLMEAGKGTRVVASLELVGYPGTSHEQSQDWTRTRYGNEFQGTLEDILLNDNPKITHALPH